MLASGAWAGGAHLDTTSELAFFFSSFFFPLFLLNRSCRHYILTCHTSRPPTRRTCRLYRYKINLARPPRRVHRIISYYFLYTQTRQNKFYILVKGQKSGRPEPPVPAKPSLRSVLFFLVTRTCRKCRARSWRVASSSQVTQNILLPVPLYC